MSIGNLGLAFLAGVLSILSPCVLPLLPVVLGAAASEHKWGAVALAMLIFGLGAGLPLMLIGSMSRQLLLRWRGSMSATSKAMKQALGLFLIGIGLLIVTGLDRSLEAGLVEVSPQWLTSITTRF